MSDLNKLLKQHRQMADMMKTMGKKGMLKQAMSGMFGKGKDAAALPDPGQLDPKLVQMAERQMMGGGSLPGGLSGMFKKKMMPALAHTPGAGHPAPCAAPLLKRMICPPSWPMRPARGPRFVGGPKTVAQAVEKFAGMIGQWVLHGYGRFTLTRRDTGAPIGHVGPLMLAEAEMPEFHLVAVGCRCRGARLCARGRAGP